MWLQSLTPVSFQMFTQQLLAPTPIDASATFLAQCSGNDFYTE